MLPAVPEGIEPSIPSACTSGCHASPCNQIGVCRELSRQYDRICTYMDLAFWMCLTPRHRLWSLSGPHAFMCHPNTHINNACHSVSEVTRGSITHTRQLPYIRLCCNSAPYMQNVACGSRITPAPYEKAQVSDGICKRAGF